MTQRKPDECVMIVAPVGQDAAAMAALLAAEGFETRICCTPGAAREQLIAGAGALVLTEEALQLPESDDLMEELRGQPPWSELPVIILTDGGESRRVRLLDLAASAAGSVTLLERPISTVTLFRSVEVALSSRRRQYQVRDLLEEQRLREQQLGEAQVKLKEHAANLEKMVAKRTHDLRATNEQLEAFVYSIAHDLRTPLRSMIGYSQLLMDDYAAGLAETPRKLLKRIEASSEFMDKLLLDLLAYGRTARSEMPLGPVEVRKGWETALFQCASQIEQLGAEVEAIEPLRAVVGHEATLGQCLANLLNNALKFVEPGTGPRVRCWTEPRGESVRVWVEDNGIGIPADEHDRVFRVFERLNGARYVGTGIGLSIVRKGVERMGGRVGVDSERGKGSRFWIELAKAN